MDWDSLLLGQICPPWTPSFRYGELDTSEFDPEFTSMPLGSMNVRDAEPVAVVDVNFSDFTFYDEHALQGENSQIRKEP
jgi:hypothetical protein